MKRLPPLRSVKDFDEEGLPELPNYNQPEDQLMRKDEKQFSLTLLTPERGEIPLPTHPVAKQKTSSEKKALDTFKKTDSKESDKQTKE